VDLLVLDELGYVPASKVGAELLFDVISTAYERTSLIVTSNLPFESWIESSAPSGSPEPPSTGSPIAVGSSRPRARATGSKTPRPGPDRPNGTPSAQLLDPARTTSQRAVDEAPVSQ